MNYETKETGDWARFTATTSHSTTRLTGDVGI